MEKIFSDEYMEHVRGYGINSHNHKHEIVLLAQKCKALEEKLLKLLAEREKDLT